MKITRRSRLLLRLQSLVFTMLFVAVIGLLAWLSTQYVYQADWTVDGRNTISEDTRQLLGTLGPAILIRASGPLMDQTGGIAAGMSGSPVYVTGSDGVPVEMPDEGLTDPAGTPLFKEYIERVELPKEDSTRDFVVPKK